MSKLTFTAVAAPYRGFVSKLRTWLTEVATFIQDSPASKADIIATLRPVVDDGDTYILASGKALTGVTPSGVFATTVTFTVAGGVITAIVLS